MATWHVGWEVSVDVDGDQDNPQGAARAAANVMAKADPHAQVYKTHQSWGEPVLVDLADGGKTL